MILFSLFDQEYLQRTDGCRLSPFTGLHFDFLNNNLQSILYSYRTVVINFTCKIMDNISSIISSINRISIIFRCNYQSASSEYVFFVLTYRIFFTEIDAFTSRIWERVSMLSPLLYHRSWKEDENPSLKSKLVHIIFWGFVITSDRQSLSEIYRQSSNLDERRLWNSNGRLQRCARVCR